MISQGLADRLRDYYKGKLCTVITSPFALPMANESFPDWFTIRIDDIDQECILGTEINRNTKHIYFFGPQLIGIIEEQVISPDHPEYEKIKKKVEENNKKAVMPTQPIETKDQLPVIQHNSPIEKIAQQASDIKKKWATAATKGSENG